MADLATTYYLKAKDSYPYDLEETFESLSYALSYDENHAASHCLMGRFYAEQEQDINESIYHFEQALIHDMNYIETYYFYADVLIKYNEFERVKRLLNYAKNVKGICKSCVLQRKALMKEKQGKLSKAKKLLTKAKSISIHNGEISFLEDELKRVKNKLK